uniref:Syntaxin N-terminal domain-containing protein n=1 Tax=Euplotes harpa TaxID=151035 RepID=A0A7S3J976_9SPIT|mmetsp:Transcript_27009/g.31172  ORF Transcript_27009/g.31172 Transcript_27009/m.31172 type:complete len:167 (+) Transcript_27009:174-674(+)
MEFNNNVIRDLKDQQIQEARGDKEKAASDKIQKIIIDTQQCQQQINTSLTEMAQSVDKAKEEFSKDPECRVMSSIHSTLLLKFREVLLSFQQNQTDYKTAVQSKIKRQIAIVKPDAEEEEINELAKDPEAASKLLSDQISGKVHRKLQNAVDDIQSKYEVILKLEK